MRIAWLMPLAIAAAGPAAAQVSIGPGYGYPGSPAGAYGAPTNSALQAMPYFPRSTQRYYPTVAARRLILQERYAEADQLLDHFLVRQATPEVNLLKGITALNLGDAERARWRFQKAARLTRYRNPVAIAGLAEAELKLGNTEEARAMLVKLQDQQEKCGGSCSRSESLNRMVTSLEGKLS